MKIESPFSDYYDHIQELGIDQNVIYKRETKALSVSTQHPLIKLFEGLRLGPNFYSSKGEQSGDLICNQFILGYCGQLIRGIQLIHYYPFQSHTQLGFFYDPLSLLNFVEARQKEYKVNKKFLSSIKKIAPSEELSLSPYHAFKRRKPEDILANFFTEVQTPVFLYNFLAAKSNIDWDWDVDYWSDENIILNPSLGNIHFDKIKGARTCYQDIFQFINNELKKEESTDTPMSSLEKVNQHGFDPKYGFRRRPGKKKRRKIRKNK